MSSVRPLPARRLSVSRWQVDLDRPRETVWSWASDVERLDAVTPPWFGLTPLASPSALFVGAEIEYRFRWRLLRTRWRSRIVAWQPYRFFAYEQVVGPFRYFRHEHRFEIIGGGTRMTDRVVYRCRGGRLVDRLLVAPDLDRIFAFRGAALGWLLSSETGTVEAPTAQRSARSAPKRRPCATASSSAIEAQRRRLSRERRPSH